MSDLYLEELVKRRKTGTDQALRYVLMALTAIGVVLSLLTWNLIIIAVSIATAWRTSLFFRDFRPNGNISMSTGNWMWIVS